MSDLMTVHKIYYFIHFEDGVVSLITNGEILSKKDRYRFQDGVLCVLIGTLSKPRRRRQRGHGKTEYLIGRTIAQRVRLETLYIS